MQQLNFLNFRLRLSADFNRHTSHVVRQHMVAGTGNGVVQPCLGADVAGFNADWETPLSHLARSRIVVGLLSKTLVTFCKSTMTYGHHLHTSQLDAGENGVYPSAPV